MHSIIEFDKTINSLLNQSSLPNEFMRIFIELLHESIQLLHFQLNSWKQQFNMCSLELRHCAFELFSIILLKLLNESNNKSMISLSKWRCIPYYSSYKFNIPYVYLELHGSGCLINRIPLSTVSIQVAQYRV